jgi:C-terminal processing protease CtpA/Prc
VEPSVKVELPDEDEEDQPAEGARDPFLDKALETLQAQAKKAA